MNAEIITFAVAAVFAVVGALGVVLARNPVHSALFLVQTLFAIAVLFIAQEAYFLATIQVIVYAGAIVILFLFVIMLVGVDRAERLEVEPVVGIRPLAVVVGAALLAGLVTVIISVHEATGSGVIPVDPDVTDIEQLGNTLFTDWVFAFQLTGLLLTIAVVGAVVLARRPKGELQPLPEPAPMIVEFQAAMEAEALTSTQPALADVPGSAEGGQETASAGDGDNTVVPGSAAGGEDIAAGDNAAGPGDVPGSAEGGEDTASSGSAGEVGEAGADGEGSSGSAGGM